MGRNLGRVLRESLERGGGISGCRQFGLTNRPASITLSGPDMPTIPAVTMPVTLTLDDLYAHFPDRSDRPAITPIGADDMPEPYRGLLVHTHHMTVTVEQFYGDAVDVKVMEARVQGDGYARKSLLTLHATGVVVQLGVVHIDLSVLSPAVRREIEEQKTPLGRVLIRHNVLRTVRPVSYFRAVPSPRLAEWFGTADPTYGRLGVIYTDNEPAIRVAEILAPIR
jgi:hypothetical protein